MKKYILLLVIVSCTLNASAQIIDSDKPYMTRSLSADAIKDVVVQTSGGSISVSGVNASEARLEVYVKKNNNRGNETLSNEEIQKRLSEDYDLDINVNGGKISARAKPKDKNIDWKKALSISFKLFVPQNITSDLQTSGGSIHLNNLSGSQEFTTSGGSLHINNLSGKVKGRTSGGSIQLENSKDDINLFTSGGSIEAKNSNGNINLSTSGGSLTLKDLNGVIKANTSGGSINGKNIGGELITSTSGGSIVLNDLSCSLETSTSGGHIDVSMKELGKYLTISNSGGNINLQLPAGKGLDLKLRADNIKRSALTNFQGTIEDDEVNGKLNGGGIPVTVRAGSGRINLEFK
jgi:DUF4097 and DUF4098 domain-containing protein YvlB